MKYLELNKSKVKNAKMDIAFLLGAGVSIPAKMPSTKDLTREILCDYDKWCSTSHSGRNYQLVEEHKRTYSGQIPNQADIIEVGNFIHKVRSLLIPYFKNEADITYEDIYDALNQVHGHKSENYRNPLIEPFIEKLNGVCNGFSDNLSVQGMKFIEDVVIFRLQTNNRKAALQPLLQIVKKYKDSDIHVFTLNFDTLIEELLDKESITYEDGFSLPIYDNQVNLWQMQSLLDSKTEKIKLYKLHGSLDWEHLIGGEYNYQIVKIKKTMKHYPYFEQGGDVRVHGRDTGLMGISNKLLSYNYGIFLDMLSLFNLQLKRCNILIISGYSFSDYGVNLRIIDWMSHNEEAKIILIDPYSKTTLEKSRGAIYSLFGQWIESDRLKIVNDSFQNWDCSI